jgi:undecaprenyl-diphosphatase
LNSASRKHSVLYRIKKFLASARKRIVLFAAVFICLLPLILGSKVLSPVHGLQGRYYANESWDGPPALTTVDPVISLKKQIMSERTGNFDRSSAIWEGYIFAPKSSTYRFSVNSDDGSWVYLDGTLLIDNGGIHPAKQADKEISLSRGTHSLRIKYFDAGGEGNIDFQWMEIRTPKILMFLLPRLYLYPKPVSFGVIIWDTVLIFFVFLFKAAFLAVGLLLLILALGVVGRRARAAAGVATAVFIGLFLLILGAKAAIPVDMTLFKIINTHHTPFFDWFFLFVSNLGNGWVMLPLLFVFILWGTPKNRRTHIIFIAVAALSINIICNNVIKQYVDRPRPVSYFFSPNIVTPTEEWRLYEVHVVGDRLRDHSFPSGHANIIFAVATLMVIIFGIKLWPAFLMAMMVAYSRVYMGAHFPLDTLGGACIGTVIALAVWRGAEIIASPKNWT